ncbi:MAG: tail protein X [Campylobacteraceae bacterium]|jgi:phage tail protein X|nr:tail protein X [Campylobacteraceae bacterium]
MVKYIAHTGERLDTIVYKYYGTLEQFEQILMLNARLKPLLEDEDIVYLPDTPKNETKKEAPLW